MVETLFHLAFIGPGGPEILVIMLVLIMMFGAKDAPRILRKLNAMLSQIRNTADGFKREIMYGDITQNDPASDVSDGEPPHDDDYLNTYGEDELGAMEEEFDSDQVADDDGEAGDDKKA